jgi:hypothetical protein
MDPEDWQTGGRFMTTIPLMNEEVSGYSVTIIRNPLLDYQHVIALDLRSGLAVRFEFPSHPPQDEWITWEENLVRVQLEPRFYSEIYQLLRNERPLYFNTIDIDFLGGDSFLLTSARPGGPALPPTPTHDEAEPPLM